jgi:hypothetical protein
MRSFWSSRIRPVLRAALARFDGRDLLLLLALGCLTAGVWVYAPGAALIVLGALLLTGWALPVAAALWVRRG